MLVNSNNMSYPSEFFQSTSEPFSTRNFTISKWPIFEARINAVHASNLIPREKENFMVTKDFKNRRGTSNTRKRERA